MNMKIGSSPDVKNINESIVVTPGSGKSQVKDKVEQEVKQKESEIDSDVSPDIIITPLNENDIKKIDLEGVSDNATDKTNIKKDELSEALEDNLGESSDLIEEGVDDLVQDGKVVVDEVIKENSGKLIDKKDHLIEQISNLDIDKTKEDLQKAIVDITLDAKDQLGDKLNQETIKEIILNSDTFIDIVGQLEELGADMQKYIDTHTQQFLYDHGLMVDTTQLENLYGTVSSLIIDKPQNLTIAGSNQGMDINIDDTVISMDSTKLPLGDGEQVNVAVNGIEYSQSEENGDIQANSEILGMSYVANKIAADLHATGVSHYNTQTHNYTQISEINSAIEKDSKSAVFSMQQISIENDVTANLSSIQIESGKGGFSYDGTDYVASFSGAKISGNYDTSLAHNPILSENRQHWEAMFKRFSTLFDEGSSYLESAKKLATMSQDSYQDMTSGLASGDYMTLVNTSKGFQPSQEITSLKGLIEFYKKVDTAKSDAKQLVGESISDMQSLADPEKYLGVDNLNVSTEYATIGNDQSNINVFGMSFNYDGVTYSGTMKKMSVSHNGVQMSSYDIQGTFSDQTKSLKMGETNVYIPGCETIVSMDSVEYGETDQSRLLNINNNVRLAISNEIPQSEIERLMGLSAQELMDDDKVASYFQYLTIENLGDIPALIKTSSRVEARFIKHFLSSNAYSLTITDTKELRDCYQAWSDEDFIKASYLTNKFTEGNFQKRFDTFSSDMLSLSKEKSLYIQDLLERGERGFDKEKGNRKLFLYVPYHTGKIIAGVRLGDPSKSHYMISYEEDFKWNKKTASAEFLGAEYRPQRAIHMAGTVGSELFNVDLSLTANHGYYNVKGDSIYSRSSLDLLKEYKVDHLLKGPKRKKASIPVLPFVSLGANSKVNFAAGFYSDQAITFTPQFLMDIYDKDNYFNNFNFSRSVINSEYGNKIDIFNGMSLGLMLKLRQHVFAREYDYRIDRTGLGISLKSDKITFKADFSRDAVRDHFGLFTRVKL